MVQPSNFILWWIFIDRRGNIVLELRVSILEGQQKYFCHRFLEFQQRSQTFFVILLGNKYFTLINKATVSHSCWLLSCSLKVFFLPALHELVFKQGRWVVRHFYFLTLYSVIGNNELYTFVMHHACNIIHIICPIAIKKSLRWTGDLPVVYSCFSPDDCWAEADLVIWGPKASTGMGPSACNVFFFPI